ncbi:rCG55691 [Rattus norvegicus]|uniref:RCG55691 n=1 Tax=Rattus norvegicus TaxID=10116 RepID=A6JQM1_RAT|nr:rCG55691 [Rattus norvegicus]
MPEHHRKHWQDPAFRRGSDHLYALPHLKGRTGLLPCVLVTLLMQRHSKGSGEGERNK